MSENTPTPRTGQIFEYDVFGKNSSGKKPEQQPFKPLSECMQEAIKIARNEGWDASNPSENLLITRLLTETRNSLEKQGLHYKVEVYPAINTALDYIHSVDGFFVASITGEPENIHSYFLFDLSLHTAVEIKPGISILKRRSFESDITKQAEYIAKVLQKSMTRQQLTGERTD